MKILMLTDRFALGGAETHIAALIHALRAQGVQIEAASAGGAYTEQLTREGVPHHTLDLATRSPAALLAARKVLTALLEQGQYDLVHAHARLPAFLCDPICRRMNIPLVTTAHWVFRADGWRGRLSRWGSYTLAVSQDIRRYLIDSYGLSPDRIALTRNGIDTRLFFPRGDALPCRGRLMHVSRLDEGRAAAAEALIGIAPQLAEIGFHSLTIVGDGTRYPALKKKAQAANLALGKDFIRMPGGSTDIAPLLRESDIFVGVSRAALEAMACGLPTILAGDEGYLSLLTPDTASRAEASNFCCRGAPPLDSAQLLEDLQSLFHDPARQKESGEFAAEYVRHQYTAERMGKDALQAYSIALKRTDSPVIICGYYGFENVGDETVLKHLIEGLRRDGYGNITVLSAAPERTARQHQVASCNRLALSTIRRAGKSNGIFLLGGGNLLQNETSSRSLFYYTRLMHYARRCGCRIWVVGGIGKLTPRGERTAGHALRAVDGFLGRTPHDVAYFQQLAPKRAAAQLLPDGALWTRPARNLPHNLPHEPFILLALRGESARQKDSALIDACALMAQHEGLRVVLCCMHPTQDAEAARWATARIPRARLLPPLTAEVLIALLQAHGRLVVATRLHMLLFAAVAGTPAISLHDGGKISDYAAFAAACNEKSNGLLYCLQQGEDAKAAMQRALHTPRSKEQQRRFLSHLRAGTNGFSLLAATEWAQKQNHQ